ncbi:MAG: type IV pilin [Methanomicrobiales archaeon]|nr:type IV pilin [Methanomicrobiales archaeon]
MRCINGPDAGVSEIVGEMLMIGLVIILISVFAAAFFNFFPATREPGVTVLMSNDRQNITFWHKGGDWIQTSELTVIIVSGESVKRIPWDSAHFAVVPEKDVLDLGSNITLSLPEDLLGNETVKLVTPKTVLFTGVVHP